MTTTALYPGRLIEGCRFWCEARDGDRVGFDLYRRHYSAKKNPRPKIRQFVGPGNKLVLINPEGTALFAWRKYIDDGGQIGVNCAVFRNESAGLSSDMIREADEIAWRQWPGERLYTFVDDGEVQGPNPGYCFKMAGWRLVRDAGGKPLRTKKRAHLILEMLPEWVEMGGPA